MSKNELLEKFKKRPAIMWDRRYANAFFNLFTDTFGLRSEPLRRRHKKEIKQ